MRAVIANDPGKSQGKQTGVRFRDAAYKDDQPQGQQ